MLARLGVGNAVLALVLASALVFTMGVQAQQSKGGKAGKEHAFHGKVEKVDLKAKLLTVNFEKVEGWMDGMTMPFNVDNPEVLTKIKAGDQITAKVYDGDYTLHNVQVVPKENKK
jgi:Cu/Ag efflux protein CusF